MEINPVTGSRILSKLRKKGRLSDTAIIIFPFNLSLYVVYIIILDIRL